MEAVSTINALVPLTLVVETLGLEVKRDAVMYQTYQCVFGHSDTSPSLHITPSKNAFNCLACQKKGSTYKFVKEYLQTTTGEHVTFNTVVNWLSAIVPAVLDVKVTVTQEREIDPDKKNNFKHIITGVNATPIIRPEQFTADQRRLYITGIMKGFDNETLIDFVKLGAPRDVEQTSLFKELLSEYAE